MKNVTTHETSAALKAAGFPQREPETGQFWYDDSGVLVCIGFSYDPGGSIARFKQTFAFAPTAADILRELFGKLQFSHTASKWIYKSTRTGKFWASDNPAEACALAWLELKKEKLWAEIDAAIPATGPLREKFNTAKRTVELAFAAADFVKKKDFDGLLSFFEDSKKPKFQPGGIVEKPIAPESKK